MFVISIPFIWNLEFLIKSSLNILVFLFGSETIYSQTISPIEGSTPSFSSLSSSSSFSLFPPFKRTTKIIVVINNDKANNKYIEDLLYNKIKKIAFTDSAHGNNYKNLQFEGLKIFRQISRNYVCSTKPVGTFISGKISERCKYL